MIFERKIAHGSIPSMPYRIRAPASVTTATESRSPLGIVTQRVREFAIVANRRRDKRVGDCAVNRRAGRECQLATRDSSTLLSGNPRAFESQLSSGCLAVAEHFVGTVVSIPATMGLGTVKRNGNA